MCSSRNLSLSEELNWWSNSPTSDQKKALVHERATERDAIDRCLFSVLQVCHRQQSALSVLLGREARAGFFEACALGVGQWDAREPGLVRRRKVDAMGTTGLVGLARRGLDVVARPLTRVTVDRRVPE